MTQSSVVGVWQTDISGPSVGEVRMAGETAAQDVETQVTARLHRVQRRSAGPTATAAAVRAEPQARERLVTRWRQLYLKQERTDIKDRSIQRYTCACVLILIPCVVS